MNENAKIIQDLSLLYELSLAVGSSLDIQANSLHFFRTLLRRKNLAFASLWLLSEDQSAFEMVCAQPAFRVAKRRLSVDHPAVQFAPGQPVFSLSSEDEGFAHFIHENQIQGGVYIVYRLQNLGFVKLYSNNRPEGFSPIELSQLLHVMDKFRVSLEGCLASQSHQKEATQRLAAQQAVERSNIRLRESETKMRKIIDSSLDAVITIDEAGNVTEWGRQTEQIFGYTRAEAMGKSLGDLIVPERFRESHERGMQHFLTTGEGPVLNQLLELVGVHKEGHEFPIEISITAIKTDDSYFFSSFIRDITERKKIENALRQSEEKYRGIIENMELGLLEVTAKGHIVRAYDRFCEMSGYTNEELAGKIAEDVLLPEEYRSFLRQQNEDRKQGVANIYEVQLRRKSGELIWVLISGAPIYDGDGEMVGSLGIHYDITHRKRLEQDLKEARLVAEQARAAEQQFLANMSHEIRTPMNTVIGMTHLLYETQPTSTQKEYLHALRFSADSLLGIIDNILDMSKIEAGKLEFESRAFNLQELLRSLQRTFQFRVREKPISVGVAIDPQIKNLVMGDPTRLNQMLTNLLGNASKFTEEGIIGVKATLVKGTPSSYHIRFEVHDTGIGIAEDKLDVIFENFKQADVKMTRKYGGTGLGLAIVKELVELQGGRIWAESQAQKGSSFFIELALGNTGATMTEKPPENDALEAQRKSFIKQLNILVVEDNPMNQKLVKQILRIWGTQYQMANNGVEAIAKSEQEKFDVILMDIHMPELDGYGATRAIRAAHGNPNHETPILALTAAALVTEKEEAFRAGMNDFLTKPFSPKLLEDTILQVLAIDFGIEEEKATTTTIARPVIDLTYLKDFSGGDMIFIRDMLETFLRETPGALRTIQERVAEKDWDAVYKQVHRLKPNLMMLGLEDLRAEAAALEQRAKHREESDTTLPQELFRFTQRVQLCYDPLREELANW